MFHVRSLGQGEILSDVVTTDRCPIAWITTMKLKEMLTFTWSLSLSLPLIATGIVAGALNKSFCNESRLKN